MKLKELHKRAMHHADLARIAKSKGNEEESHEHYRSAYEFESEAAQLLAGDTSVEPTRSILHRSAATLALRCGLERDAERLAAAGLAGDPPEDLADELRDVLEQANFMHHLSLRGKRLHPDELRLALSGSAIGHGIAPEKEVTKRIQTTKRMLARTYIRLKGEPFTSRMKEPKGAELFIEVPRAASFAAVLKLGGLQQPLLRDDLPGQAIREVAACLHLYNSHQEEELKSQIRDDNYYTNFTSLAKDLAPDGKRVRQVGITITREHNKPYSVSITRIRPKSRVPPAKPTDKLEPVVLRGKLIAADGEEEAVWIERNQKRRKVHVPDSLDDVVRTRWLEEVEVTCKRDGQKLVLEEVDSIEDEESEESGS